MKFLKVIILLLLFTGVISSETHKVVFMADWSYAQKPAWLNRIKLWGATGVNLIIDRIEVEDASHNYHWGAIKNALDLIDKTGGLDIYIRVKLIFFQDVWFSKEDYQYTANGQLVYNYNLYNPATKTAKRILNITSPKVKASMLTFMDSTVRFLDRLKYKNKIRLVVPTLSPDDETELPSSSVDKDGRMLWPVLTGYSKYEKEAFVNFLRKRYDNKIEKLRDVWSSNNVSGDISKLEFDKIADQMDSYDWAAGDKVAYDYFPAGRKDFLDFRRDELKKFIDAGSVIVKKYFDYGIQLGSIYDEGIEYRGFYDVTPLVENVNCIINDEVPQFHPNFNFAANMLRSVCKFWQAQKPSSKKIIFGSEANWPGYLNLSPDTLVKYWIKEADAYYDRGSTILYISHWGTQVEKKVSDNFTAGMYDNDGHYSNWKDYLQKLKIRKTNAAIYKKSDIAVHVGFEQGLYANRDSGEFAYSHNEHFLTGHNLSKDAKNKVEVYDFPLNRFGRPLSSGTGESKAQAYDSYDILTNYMIAHNPDYLKKYKTILFSRTSSYISERAFKNLSSKYRNKLRSGNRTLNKEGINKAEGVPGLKNEYNIKRSVDTLKQIKVPDYKP